MPSRLLIAGLIFFYATLAPAAEPKFQTPSNTVQLAKLLKESNYDPISLTKEVFQITIDRKGWKVHLLISLSKDGERIWLESKFSPVAEPERVPASTWLKLLETNDQIGPAHFVFDANDRRVHILKAFDNQRITAERLKKEIDALDATIRATHAFWRPEVFIPEREVITVQPREVEDGKSALAAFQGEWQIVTIELRGKTVAEAQLADSKPTLTFQNESACLKTGPDNQRNVKIRIEPGSDPKQIDFEDDQGHVEKGIYRRDGATIKFCFGGPGMNRPTQFGANAEKGTWILILRRKP